ncbi:hypothetical protein RDI58_013460 [Solanum bulbocastanum]|uniref:Uncharacterized protein n=1 Tax=Solanum bulbocastanum TaxID=147425 RepID=A0AAN8TM81_SOLBU
MKASENQSLVKASKNPSLVKELENPLLLTALEGLVHVVFQQPCVEALEKTIVEPLKETFVKTIEEKDPLVFQSCSYWVPLVQQWVEGHSMYNPLHHPLSSLVHVPF